MKNFLFGPKAILEAINNSYVRVKKIYLCKNKINKFNFNSNIKIEYVEHTFFNQFDKTLNHQFICAEIESNNFYNDIEQFLNDISKTKNKTFHKKNLILILDEINDPRNFGSIIRTAYALGVLGIVYKKDNQVQINELVQKTSLGASSFIPLIKVVNLSRTIEILKKYNYWIYSSCLFENSVNAFDVEYDQNTVLVVGNEQYGISDNILKNSDFHIKIQMQNDFDSLNVAVATGILISNIMNK